MKFQIFSHPGRSCAKLSAVQACYALAWIQLPTCLGSLLSQLYGPVPFMAPYMCPQATNVCLCSTHTASAQILCLFMERILKLKTNYLEKVVPSTQKPYWWLFLGKYFCTLSLFCSLIFFSQLPFLHTCFLSFSHTQIVVVVVDSPNQYRQ